MFLGIKLSLAVSFSFFVSLTTAQPATCGGNPDATTAYTNAIDITFPKALAEYTAAVSAFPSSNATPEDIDRIYHAGDNLYFQWLTGPANGLALTGVEIIRECPNAPIALATVFNSTSKIKALYPQLSNIMSGVSRFEPQILEGVKADWEITAQGRSGHWAIYQTLDFLTYNLWYVVTKSVRQELAQGKPSALEDAFREYYDAVEAVRVQYYRKEYGNPPQRP